MQLPSSHPSCKALRQTQCVANADFSGTDSFSVLRAWKDTLSHPPPPPPGRSTGHAQCQLLGAGYIDWKAFFRDSCLNWYHLKSHPNKLCYTNLLKALGACGLTRRLFWAVKYFPCSAGHEFALFPITVWIWVCLVWVRKINYLGIINCHRDVSCFVMKVRCYGACL